MSALQHQFLGKPILLGIKQHGFFYKKMMLICAPQHWFLEKIDVVFLHILHFFGLLLIMRHRFF